MELAGGGGQGWVGFYCRQPQGGTGHPAPSTQHKAPSTEHPAQGTQRPARGTQQAAQGTKHRAPSTQHRAPSTEHPAQSTQHSYSISSHYSLLQSYEEGRTRARAARLCEPPAPPPTHAHFPGGGAHRAGATHSSPFPAPNAQAVEQSPRAAAEPGRPSGWDAGGAGRRTRQPPPRRGHAGTAMGTVLSPQSSRRSGHLPPGAPLTSPGLRPSRASSIPSSSSDMSSAPASGTGRSCKSGKAQFFYTVVTRSRSLEPLVAGPCSQGWTEPPALCPWGAGAAAIPVGGGH